MRAETAEWLAKADADLRAARRESQVAEDPSPDVACFLCQQCVEKCLKARLVEGAVAFPKSHDLERLLDLLTPLEPAWEEFREQLQSLTDMAVEVRYPGFSAASPDAAESLQVAEAVRCAVRSSLGV